MPLVKFFKRLNPLREDGYLDRKKDKAAADIAVSSIRAALVEIDSALPKISAAAQGRPVKLRYRVEGDVTFQLDTADEEAE